MDGDIGEIKPKHSNEKAGDSDIDALVSLIVNRESDVWKHLDRVSHKAASKLQDGEDKDDVKQEIMVRVWPKILDHTIVSPDHFKAYVCTTANNLCKNHYRHKEVENSYCERFGIASKENARHEGESVVECLAFISPDQEEKVLLKERKKIVNDAVRKVRSSLPPERVKILDMWGARRSVKEIADAMKRSEKTIYPILKEILTAVIEEAKTQEHRK